MENPNFLILDEPTNDLDILTLNVLENFLLDFPGCVIIVSHDRYFMDKIVDHLFIFEGQGKVRDFNGKYVEYLDEKKERLREEKRQEKAKASTKKAPPKNTSTQKSGLSYAERKEMNRLEKEISKIEERKTAIHDRLCQPDITTEEITELSKELGSLNKEIETKEERWMELAESA